MERIGPLLVLRWPRALLVFNRELWLSGVASTAAFTALSLVFNLKLIDGLCRSTTGHDCAHPRYEARSRTFYAGIICLVFACFLQWLLAWHPSGSSELETFVGFAVFTVLFHIIIILFTFTGPLTYHVSLHPDHVLSVHVRFRILPLVHFFGIDWTAVLEYTVVAKDRPETIQYSVFILGRRVQSVFGNIARALGKSIGRGVITWDSSRSAVRGHNDLPR